MNITYSEDRFDRASRLIVKDEYDNKAEVIFPHKRERGFGRINVGVEWLDAEVRSWSSVDGSADDVGQAAEFMLQVAHIAKTLDLAFADEREEVVGEQERWNSERELRDKVKKRAQQMRCEELSQYYMQLVRVQREGHSSHAKGELQILMLGEGTDDERISVRMTVKESNGNRWRFEADRVAKFEVKDGNRYNKIKLTPMLQLEATARKEIEVAA
jgi:hypothetical protein